MSRTKFALTVEHSERVLRDKTLRVGNLVTMFTPPLDEDYWLLRVMVSERQAIVLFPKFGTFGIGFQHEKDWNTNLPAGCVPEEIYRHIGHNKQDRGIPKARCLAAIRLLQAEIVRLTGKRKYQPYRLEDGTEISAMAARDRGLLPDYD